MPARRSTIATWTSWISACVHHREDRDQGRLDLPAARRGLDERLPSGDAGLHGMRAARPRAALGRRTRSRRDGRDLRGVSFGSGGAPRGSEPAPHQDSVTARARYCLACGARPVTAMQEGRRRRRCRRCGFTFYDNPTPAAVAIIEGREGILLARRGGPPYQGTWDLPGGFLESGELPDRGLL